MSSPSRHQCLVYEGAPSRHLPALASLVRQKLSENYRCLYLNSPVMVAGVRCYLAAAGIDVAHESAKASLVLSSDQGHLVQGSFDVDRMMHTLEEALGQALSDGYEGLWATGDMTWELGSQKNLGKLLEYEWRLEDFLSRHPAMCGICQYHADTLPAEVLRQGLLSHSSIFINETLSYINPHFLHAESYSELAVMNPELDSMLSRVAFREDAS
jgi:hypothetical protein